ncbi:hypothetical protein JL722_124 [Aureococcus anophagefferens]|nr:hypothetical protein JL722_124 [Aureococcus anophagefferens]
MACLFVVTGKKGAVCRAGVELDSERLVDVPKGETVYVVEASSSACGVARLHVAFPVDGWVSAKVVGRWSSQAKRTKHGRDGGGLGFTVGEPPLSKSLGRAGAPSDRDGYVALPAHLDEPGGFTRVACPLSQLGECADSSCSCYRPSRPRCRAQFRDLARDLCCERLGSAPGALDRGGVLRYASIGSGLLLSDAEVLGALIRDGFELRSACVVDTCYARNKLAPRTEAALQEFANFVGAPVHVFSSMGALARPRCSAGRRRTGSATSDDNFGRAWRADDDDDAPWRVAGAVPGAFRPRPRPKSDDLGFQVYGGGGRRADASEVLAYGAPGDNPCHDSDAQRKNCPRLDKRRRQICASGDLDGDTSPTSSATPPMLPRDASCTSLEELEELTLLRARWLRSS